jgi:hypothetical protein
MPSGLIHGHLITPMTLSDHQVHDWIASIVDRTADQLRGELQLLLSRVQEAAPTHEVVAARERLSPPAPGFDSNGRAGAPSAAHHSDEHATSILAADVLAAMAALDEVESLSAILTVLVDRAAVHAGRVLLVLARGDRLIGWRWHGYSTDPTDARTVEIAPHDRGLIARAARTGVTATGREPAVGEPGDLSDHGHDAVAVPLRVEGQVVAVLYADAPPDGADASTAADLVRRPWPEVVGVLARHGARCLESMTARRLPELLRTESGAAPFPAAEAI